MIEFWHHARVRTSSWFALASLLGSSLALACIDDATVAESSSSDEANESTSATSESLGSESDTSEATSTSATETGETEPHCGDGILDPDEECDDGNDDESDGCTSACESACATRGWFDVTIPEGWFDIQAIAPRPGNELAALGNVELAGQAGRLRMVNVAEDQVVAALESDPLGPIGTLELPQTHQIDAIASTPGGESILVLGTSTEVLVVDEPPIVRFWLARFAGDSLVEQWRVELPVDAPELRPIGLAVLDDGDAIVSRTLELAANDRDLGVERRSAGDGSVVWTSSVSGPLEAGWSLDAAGQVALGGGRLWATAILRVDWQTFETNLIELDPDTGALLWSDVPLADTGSTHEQHIASLAAGPGGTVALTIDVSGPGNNYGAAFGYVERELVWEIRPEDLPWTDGEPYLSPRVSVDEDGDALIVGRYTHDFGSYTAPRPWVVAMAPEGKRLCAARIGEGQQAAVVPALGFYGGGLAALNLDTFGIGGMGPGSGGNWIVALRGW